MQSVRKFGIVLFALAVVLSACQAQSGGGITITDAWGRPGLAGGNGAVYFTLENRSGQDDNLLKASSDAAEVTEVHLSSMDAEGKMSMHPQEKVAIKAGEKVEFKPGGLHVMLIRLKSDLQVGQKITVTLTFEKAGDIQIEAVIQEP